MSALDLGTTNTLLARWDPEREEPALCELPAIARKPGGGDALEAPRAIPSAVHVFARPGLLARLGPVSRRFLLGQTALIGRPALDANQMRQRSAFTPSFKRALMQSPLRPIVRVENRGCSAREVAAIFLRELFAEAKRQTGERIRELVITVPSDAFETYRAELSSIARSLGVRRLRFLDEPVAAAIGYGLSSAQRRRVLVVDFGGGTMHMALVELDPKEARTGSARVVAKASRDLGGNLVDRWLLDELCQRLEVTLDPESEPDQLWRGLMLTEAQRMKEALHLSPRATFSLSAPEGSRGSRRFEAQLRGEAGPLELEQADLVRLLEERGLYQGLSECLDEALLDARNAGLDEEAIDDVLMVGGSTLLPGVYSLFEKRFGRGRVRAWQPFEAVAYGATIFAADRVEPADFIVHDYALLIHDARTQAARPVVVVPRGTRIPTADDFWKRQLVPSCALGEPEKIFKLVICEISESQGRTFAWNSEGELQKLGSHNNITNINSINGISSMSSAPPSQMIVKLNEANPALGHLDPPHSPSDQKPRLEVSFGVNAERWLCATVVDLKKRKTLMRGEPVVRLA